MLSGNTAGLRSSLDMTMFHLTVWLEQQRVLKVLKAMSDDVLGDTESLSVEGDYFSVRLPNGGIFRGLLIEDNVQKARNSIAQALRHEQVNLAKEG